MIECQVKRLRDAPTIKELHDRLEEAIAIVGDDAAWNGFDDEAICIDPKKDGHVFILIGRPEEFSLLLKSQNKL